MWELKQKIVSRTEPELGLGVITHLDQNQGTLKAFFSECSETRLYAIGNAPLQRYQLNIGDTFDAKGRSFKVEKIVHHGKLIKYISGTDEFWEDEITSCSSSKNDILDRFFSGNWSNHKAYDLRQEAWNIRSKSQKGLVKGLVGARVQPLPHQLYIASHVARRPFPRVLLADEVGLGKTIEAGLIFSSLKVLGRADRVLVLTPDSLIHQWMTELYRRFGEMFSVLNEERCQQEEDSQKISPFQANQRVLVSMNLLVGNRQRLREALDARWDLIIIDEAHHLDWDIEEPNEEWKVAKELSEVCSSLLLLTATPRQHGLATQFGLLNLVDPSRYSDFDDFLDESESLRETAEIAKSLAQGAWDQSIKLKLQKIFCRDTSMLKEIQEKGSQNACNNILKSLVDRHGTGRVLFRNRRERLKGFPERVLFEHQLNPSASYLKNLENLDPLELEDINLMDYATGRGFSRSFCDKIWENPRYIWLAQFIKNLKNEKVFVICASKDRVLEVEEYLSQCLHINSKNGLKIAIFHEDLSIVDRDREAALFADPNGAQVLISSEIGGEGRNFQCAKKLVIFDLPRLPDLLEQRIGRLDRIGQGNRIEIHVPWIVNSPEEVLFHWYQKGLNSFTSSWNGADSLLEFFADDIIFLFRLFFPKHPEYSKRKKYLSTLIERTEKKAKLLKLERAESVDVLVDLNSYDAKKGEKLLELVEDCDDDPQLEFFIRSVFDHYGVDYEEIDDRGSIVIRADSLMFIDKFPGLNADSDTLVTFDRDVALAREDMSYLTVDHKLAESSLSLLLDRDEGLASFCKWLNPTVGRGVILEISLILEAVGPKNLELGRYLPILTKEVIVNQHGVQIKEPPYKKELHVLHEMQETELPLSLDQLRASINPILEKALNLGSEWAEKIKEEATINARKELNQELDRLIYLAELNPNVSRKEVEIMEKFNKEVLFHLEKAKARLDSFRIIFVN